jgi:isopenicillin N synthase-like dioxygenase
MLHLPTRTYGRAGKSLKPLAVHRRTAVRFFATATRVTDAKSTDNPLQAAVRHPAIATQSGGGVYSTYNPLLGTAVRHPATTTQVTDAKSTDNPLQAAVRHPAIATQSGDGVDSTYDPLLGTAVRGVSSTYNPLLGTAVRGVSSTYNPLLGTAVRGVSSTYNPLLGTAVRHLATATQVTDAKSTDNPLLRTAVRRPAIATQPGGGVNSTYNPLLGTSVRHLATATRAKSTYNPLHATMPPNHGATPVDLETFDLPKQVTGTAADLALSKSMIAAFRRDGIFQIKLTPAQSTALSRAFDLAKAFFREPLSAKSKHVDDQNFAGYVASGEELTDDIRDYPEIFTVIKDLPQNDFRVQRRWPCHGPCPWPNDAYAAAMQEYMTLLGSSGEKLLQLLTLGLGLTDPHALTRLTKDGWHHMRVLRFPAMDQTNGKGKSGRGIGSHTDYGLLVLSAQDEVGGLFIRRPIEGENWRNWEKSVAGYKEADEEWSYIPPEPNVMTVMAGRLSYTPEASGHISFFCLARTRCPENFRELVLPSHRSFCFLHCCCP